MKQILIYLLMITSIAHAYPPAGTLHDIAVDFQSTFSIIEYIKQDTGLPTFIHQEDVGIAGYSISNPGFYKLGESIAFSPMAPGNAITIAADNVTLDLSCFMLSQDNSQSGVNGVAINPSQTTTKILNGMINNFTNNGIEVGNSVDGLKIEKTILEDNSRGIHFNGSSTSPITSAAIKGVECVGSTTALHLVGANGSLFKGITALETINAAFDIQESYTNIFQDITIYGVHNDATVYGFKLEDGGNNQINNATIAGISTSSTDTLDKAVGIEIGAQEYNDTIRGNGISTIWSSTTSLVAGINMVYTFTALSNSGFPSEEYNGNEANPADGVYAVAWSPDGRYLAIGQTQLTPASGDETNETTQGIIRILQFDGSSLLEIASETYSGEGVYSVAWSPDGRYLAIGQTRLFSVSANQTNETSRGIIRILQFDGSSLLEIASETYTDDGIYSVAWSPDGRYVAIGQTQLVRASGDETNFTEQGILRILQFDGDNLIEIDNITYNENGNGNPDPGVYSVAWSPDGRYLAIGQTQLTPVAGGTPAIHFTSQGVIRVLQFDGSSLIQIAIETYNGTQANPADGVYAVSWSPDGRYVAVGQTQLIADIGNETNFTEQGILRIFQFDGNSLIEIDNITYNENGSSNPDPGVYSVSWSPDGRYLAIGQTELTQVSGFPAETNFTEQGIVRILQFDGSSLIEIDDITYNENGSNNPDPGVYSAAWSPDGRSLAIGQTQLTQVGAATPGTNFTSQGVIRILSSLNFSDGHAIAGNDLSTIFGADLALTFSDTPAVSSGRGIQASSGGNAIVNNRVTNTNIAYTFVAAEQYLRNVQNLKLKNQFPNPLSNVASNSDYQFARTRNSP